MPTIPIADDLLITTRINQTAPNTYMGVEVSQPILVLGDDVVAVAGEVSAVQLAGAENCFLEVQQSLDLLKWCFVQRTTLPPTPGPFELSNVPVSMTYARVRYVIEGPMTATTYWQLSASSSSGQA